MDIASTEPPSSSRARQPEASVRAGPSHQQVQPTPPSRYRIPGPLLEQEQLSHYIGSARTSTADTSNAVWHHEIFRPVEEHERDAPPTPLLGFATLPYPPTLIQRTLEDETGRQNQQYRSRSTLRTHRTAAAQANNVPALLPLLPWNAPPAAVPFLLGEELENDNELVAIEPLPLWAGDEDAPHLAVDFMTLHESMVNEWLSALAAMELQRPPPHQVANILESSSNASHPPRRRAFQERQAPRRMRNAQPLHWGAENVRPSQADWDNDPPADAESDTGNVTHWRKRSVWDSMTNFR